MHANVPEHMQAFGSTSKKLFVPGSEQHPVQVVCVQLYPGLNLCLILVSTPVFQQIACACHQLGSFFWCMLVCLGTEWESKRYTVVLGFGTGDG